MSDLNEKDNKQGRFWGIHFVCTNCNEFRWRMDEREYSQEAFEYFSEKYKADHLLVSTAMDNIMCWRCQVEKKKQDQNFQPPEPALLDPDKGICGREYAEAINELLQNAHFSV